MLRRHREPGLVESGTVDEGEWTYEWFLEIRVERLGFPPLTDEYEKIFFVLMSGERFLFFPT